MVIRQGCARAKFADRQFCAFGAHCSVCRWCELKHSISLMDEWNYTAGSLEGMTIADLEAYVKSQRVRSHQSVHVDQTQRLIFLLMPSDADFGSVGKPSHLSNESQIST